MAKVIPIGQKQTVEEAFTKIIQSDMARVSAWEPIAFDGKDIEGVHQMRVALRRMRSAFTVFRPAIPKKISTDISQEMRWAAHQLDHARDIDVYIDENLTNHGKKQPHGGKRMLKLARKDKKNTYDQVRKFIHGRRYNRLKKQVTNWVDNREWRDELSKKERRSLGRKVKPFAAQVLENHRTQVLTTGKNIQALDDDALHQLRIDCKKLRYATEFFSPVFGKSMTAFTKQLKELQDILGILHDTAVMSGLQQDLLKNKKQVKAKGFANKLKKQRLREARKLMKRLKKSWDAFATAKQPWRASLTPA